MNTDYFSPGSIEDSSQTVMFASALSAKEAKVPDSIKGTEGV